MVEKSIILVLFFLFLSLGFFFMLTDIDRIIGVLCFIIGGVYLFAFFDDGKFHRNKAFFIILISIILLMIVLIRFELDFLFIIITLIVLMLKETFLDFFKSQKIVSINLIIIVLVFLSLSIIFKNIYFNIIK